MRHPDCLPGEGHWKGWRKEGSSSATVPLATVAQSQGQTLAVCHNTTWQRGRKPQLGWGAPRQGSKSPGRVFNPHAPRVQLSSCFVTEMLGFCRGSHNPLSFNKNKHRTKQAWGSCWSFLVIYRFLGWRNIFNGRDREWQWLSKIHSDQANW